MAYVPARLPGEDVRAVAPVEEPQLPFSVLRYLACDGGTDSARSADEECFFHNLQWLVIICNIRKISDTHL